MPMLSIVVPTRDRPDLVDNLIKSISQGPVDDIEVIIADNPSRPSTSAASVCKDAGVEWIQYRRSPRDLDICDNFEWGLQHCNGDYVTFLTDKMSFRSGALELLLIHLANETPDIVNWMDANFTPASNLAPLGQGFTEVLPLLDGSFFDFDPKQVIEIKAGGTISRGRMSKFQYAAGKIVFGTYKRSLIDSIESTGSGLFQGATHDYAASIQGLANAGRCTFMRVPWVVHLNLPRGASTGSSTDYVPQILHQYIQRRSESLGSDLLSNLPIPGLYSSVHNLVAYDMLTFTRNYGLSNFFTLDEWIPHIWDDLTLDGKSWASVEECIQQFGIFTDFLGDRETRVGHFDSAREISSSKFILRLKNHLPRSLINALRVAGFAGTKQVRVASLQSAWSAKSIGSP